MAVRYILFDLDGTLLPMDQENFTRAYFHLLTEKMAPFGYEPKGLINTIWTGTEAMVKNDGRCSNEDVFWKVFAGKYGAESVKDKQTLEEFYATEFQNARSACGYDPQAARVVKKVKDMGFRVVLATNPIFPRIATESRTRWAGLQPGSFELITTYENSYHCKPNIGYYHDILAEIGAGPEECLMVGNDVTEDMVAASLGMKVFLLTDCIINKLDQDISIYPHGGFTDMIAFVESLK